MILLLKKLNVKKMPFWLRTKASLILTGTLPATSTNDLHIHHNSCLSQKTKI